MTQELQTAFFFGQVLNPVDFPRDGYRRCFRLAVSRDSGFLEQVCSGTTNVL